MLFEMCKQIFASLKTFFFLFCCVSSIHFPPFPFFDPRYVFFVLQSLIETYSDPHNILMVIKSNEIRWR